MWKINVEQQLQTVAVAHRKDLFMVFLDLQSMFSIEIYCFVSAITQSTNKPYYLECQLNSFIFIISVSHCIIPLRVCQETPMNPLSST